VRVVCVCVCVCVFARACTRVMYLSTYACHVLFMRRFAVTKAQQQISGKVVCAHAHERSDTQMSSYSPTHVRHTYMSAMYQHRGNSMMTTNVEQTVKRLECLIREQKHREASQQKRVSQLQREVTHILIIHAQPPNTHTHLPNAHTHILILHTRTSS